jgi:hypothetical protein
MEGHYPVMAVEGHLRYAFERLSEAIDKRYTGAGYQRSMVGGIATSACAQALVADLINQFADAAQKRIHKHTCYWSTA